MLAFCALASPVEGVEQESSLYSRYEEFTATFWNAENSLQKREGSIYDIYQFPLAPDDPLYQKYFEVDNAAGSYLQELKNAGNTTSWTIPHTLYLGGIAAFTIGDYTNAQKYFSRLLRDYPNYKRDLYVNDRYDPDPDFAHPVKPAVTKLLFYCQIVGVHGGAPTKSSPSGRGLGEGKDAFTTFQQFNNTSQKVLLTQLDYSKWLANRPYHSQRRVFLNENYGDDTPDKCRASVLPTTAKLIETGWQNLFPAALKKNGATKMRTYLRELIKPDSLLREVAIPRLAEVDQILINYYFAQAKVLLKKHDFAGTRKRYKQIIAEYPDTDASRRAEIELPKVVPVAIKFYKVEGDRSFNPEKQVDVPQTKAREFFEKMYDEAAENDVNESAGYALYHWARALGTEGKFKEALEKLYDFEEKFPRSKLLSNVLFLRGFLNGDPHINKIPLAAQLMEQTAQRYPKSLEAPESLWYGAFYYAQLNQFPKAISCLEKLQQYPKNKHTKHAKEWLAYFQDKNETGGQWP